MLKHSNISYRQDIDGLRAIAVLSVLCFHLNSSFLSGGFVGVDIFFVISGYLITKILIKDIEQKNFSFSLFYIKRIRRIFPALFIVLFACLIMATLILTTEDFEWFAKTLKYASLQISNILFQRKVGYFDPAFEGMPLLHTWSLGVEEQFYLIWPVMLLLLFKFKKSKNIPFYGLIAISITSLLFSQYLINTDHQKIAFFSLPSRLWELGLGGILAFNKIKRSKNNAINELLGITGLILIAISIFIIKSDSFPGLMALLPCLGAGLIIFSGNKEKTTVTTKILSNKILVFIGLISYSLYLWHWPIIIFYKEYLSKDILNINESLLIAIISIIISYFSWKFIENPFRKKKSLNQESLYQVSFKIIKFHIYKPILFAFILMVIFVSISYSVKKELWNWRLLSNDIKPPYEALLNNVKDNECKRLVEKHNNRMLLNKCIIGNDSNPEVILFGDSHARHYATAVTDWAKKRNYTVLLITGTGCPPIFDVKLNNGSCIEMQKEALKIFTDNSKIKYVFLAGRFSIYTNGLISSFLIDDYKSQEKKSSITNAKNVFKEKLNGTIDKIGYKNKRVIFLGEIPSAGNDQVLKRSEKEGKLAIYKLIPEHKKIHNISTLEEYRNKVFYTHKTIKDISSRDKNITFFDPEVYLCDKKFCFYKKDNVFIYRDNDHINVYGGHYIGRYFDF